MIRRYQRYRVGRRWLVALAMLACVVFHAALLARFLLSAEQFQARTQRLLQQAFGGDVAVGRCRYEFPAGFRLKDLSVSRPAERGGGELFRAKGIFVDLGFLALLRGTVAVEALVLDEPELLLTKADFAEMKKPRAEEVKAQVGEVIVRGGRILIGKDVMFDGSPERELRDIAVELRRQRRLPNGYAFGGEANSSLWGRCDLEGTLDLGARRLDSKVTARGITVDERIRELLPKEYQIYAKALDRYNIAGVVDLTIESDLSWKDKGSIALKVAADLRDCRAAWEVFPLKCTEIRGRVVFDGTNIYYQNLSGRCGPATVTVSGQTTAEKIDVHLIGRGRPLDREFYEAASPPIKRLLDRCGVEAGIINTDLQSTWWRADKRFEASVHVDVRDARATYNLFPYPLSDITGSIRWENGISYIESLRGRRGNARVQVRGQVTDPGAPDLVIEASDLPLDDVLRKAVTANPHKAFDYNILFDDLKPEGIASATVAVTSRDGSRDHLQYRIVIRPEGASFQHKDFPHRITDVRGDILVDEAGTVSFRDLRGKLGTIPLQFLGSIRPGPKGPVLDITVAAAEVELCPATRALLSKEVAAVYDDLDPRGKVSYAWRLATDPATGVAHRTSEIGCLQDCSVQHKLFPLRITGLMGRAYVDDTGRATFTGMKGRLGTAALEVIAGQAAPGGAGRLNLDVRVTGLRFTDELRGALPPTWQKVWDEVRPSGEGVAEYQYTGNPEKPAQPAQRVSIEPSDGAFCYRRLPLAVSDITRGKVAFDQDGSGTITNIQGKVQGKTVQIGGKVTPGPDGSVLQIDVAADELTLNPELRAALPPEWQQMWDSLKPVGKVGVVGAGIINIQKGEWQSFRLDATLKGCEATWHKLPIPLKGLRGRFDYADGTVTLTDVVGECAVADQVRLSGRVFKKGVGADRVQIVAQNARFTPEFFAALPPEVRKTLEAMALKGMADLDLTVTTPEKGDVTQCFGLVRLRDAAFQQTHPFEQVTGDVRIEKGSVQADGTQRFEGSLDLRKLIARKYVITEAKGGFVYTRAPTGDGKTPPQAKLALSDLAGGFYGGRLNARIELDLSPSGAFAAWMSLSGADFKVFCKEALGSDGAATGSLDVRLEFPPGRFKGEKGLIGDGSASVARGDLGQLPLAASLLGALGLRSPLDRSISDASMKFGITKDQLIVKEFHLLGETRLLAGQGTIGFDGTLDLRFLSPRSGIEIPIIQQLLREQLVQVDVGGTVAQPKFNVVAVPVIPALVEQINDVLGLWRKRRPPKPSSPEAPAPSTQP